MKHTSKINSRSQRVLRIPATSVPRDSDAGFAYEPVRAQPLSRDARLLADYFGSIVNIIRALR